MVVIAFDNANESLRGLLTRWLLEVKPGVFLGEVTATVRDELWNTIVSENKGRFDGVILAYSTNTEQGFDLKSIGNPHRCIIDLEGVKLIKTLKN